MNTDRSPLHLLEESIALARRSPARGWTWYLAGAVPFFSTLLYFFRATTGVLAAPDPAIPSFILCLLFGWRQLTRSVYGRLVEGQLSETAVQIRRSPGLLIRVIARNWFGGMVRVLIPLPVPWLSALFRNYQSYAWTEDAPLRSSLAMAARGGNDFLAWLMLAAMSFFVWVNVFTGSVLLPALYRIYTGEEGILTRHADSLMNRTMVLASIMVAWCLADAVMESMYALRRYYGQSERTGADLLGAWRRAIGKTSAAGVLALILCVGLRAQMPPAPDRAALNQAIDQVLTQKQYQWRETPLHQDDHDPAIIRLVRSMIEGIRHFARSITRPVGRLWDSFWDWLRGRGDGGNTKGPSAPVNGLRLASVLATFLFAAFLVVLLLRSRSRAGKSPLSQLPSRPLPVDLRDPDVVATDLPEEQWLSLARQFMDQGDPRMALRAWFLASLAFLNRRELIAINRHKTNLDYRRELARRARAIAGLESEFVQSVRRFESAWYGGYPVDRTDVDLFAAAFDRMRGLCS